MLKSKSWEHCQGTKHMRLIWSKENYWNYLAISINYTQPVPNFYLTHLPPMLPFSTGCFPGVEKMRIGNKWVNNIIIKILSSNKTLSTSNDTTPHQLNDLFGWFFSSSKHIDVLQVHEDCVYIFVSVWNRGWDFIAR